MIMGRVRVCCGRWLAWAACLGLLPWAVLAASGAQELSEVVAKTPDLRAGAARFETCAACHGPDGGGVADGTVPVIAGQRYEVLVRQIVGFRHDRTWEPRMTHFVNREHLADAQAIADVAGYISQLPRPRRAGNGLNMFLEIGARVYLERCIGCHGTRAADGGPGSQSILAGQHYGFLLHQMLETADGHRATMSGAHLQLMRQLSWQEITGVADYLSRQVAASAK